MIVEDVDKSFVPSNLTGLARTRYETLKQVGAACGLDGRHVESISRGEQRRVQEATLLLLAKHFDIDYLDFLHKDLLAEAAPPAPRRRRTWLAALFVAFLLALLGVLVASRLRPPLAASAIVIEHEGHVVNARIGQDGRLLWSQEVKGTIAQVGSTSAWDPPAVIVATKEGELLVLDRLTGKRRWSDQPSLPALVQDFGEAAEGTWRCEPFAFVDLVGDGVPELCAVFTNQKYSPCYVRTYRSDSTVVGTYRHPGYLYALYPQDLDEDRHQEIYLVGTNNGTAHDGATVVCLDEEHLDGAAVDSIGSWSDAYTDGSRYRIIFPAYAPDVMKALAREGWWLDAYDLLFAANTKLGHQVTASVMRPAEFSVRMDMHLLPFDIVVEPALLLLWNGAQQTGALTRAGSAEEYLRGDYAQTIRYYVEGQRTPWTSPLP